MSACMLLAHTALLCAASQTAAQRMDTIPSMQVWLSRVAPYDSVTAWLGRWSAIRGALKKGDVKDGEVSLVVERQRS